MENYRIIYPFNNGLPMLLYKEFCRDERLDEVIDRVGNNCYNRLSPSFGKGLERLIQAEGELVKGNFVEAYVLALQAVALSAPEKQYYVTASARYVMLKAEYMCGGQEQAEKQLEAIRGIYEKVVSAERGDFNRVIFNNFLELCEGFYFLLTEQHPKIGEVYSSGKQPHIRLNDSDVLYKLIVAKSAIALKKFSEAQEICLGYLYSDFNDNVLIKIEFSVLLAIAERGLFKKGGGRIMDAIMLAYADEIKLPFIENATYVLPILEDLGYVETGDEGFIDKIMKDCRTFLSKKGNNDNGISGFSLTEKEKEVLFLVSRECTCNEIALKLRIQKDTVKKHLLAINRKLGVNSRSSAISVAQAYNLI